jgi:hypothetical protein
LALQDHVSSGPLNLLRSVHELAYQCLPFDCVISSDPSNTQNILTLCFTDYNLLHVITKSHFVIAHTAEYYVELIGNVIHLTRQFPEVRLGVLACEHNFHRIIACLLERLSYLNV